MSINRRDFLKLSGAGLGGLALSPSENGAVSLAFDDVYSMLYDATICVGCKACQVACKDRLIELYQERDPNQDVQALFDKDPDGIYEAPWDLSAHTYTLIKLYQAEDQTWSFVKKQCMHCNEPACVSVCPVAALHKTEEGPVAYREERCIGCRYCMAACPFGIPKYQWEKTFPLIQKCDFCHDRLAEGLPPACGNACPTGALIYGKRSELLAIAEKRINDNPGKYIDHVYGKNEVGGTSMLYLSHVPFEDLGFPPLEENPLPEITWPYLSFVPAQIVIVGGLMTGIYFYTRRKGKEGKEEI